MGEIYQCWRRICREINVFFGGFEYQMFYVLYPFVTYLLTPSYIKTSHICALLEILRKWKWPY
jgi:hypothetical protein